MSHVQLPLYVGHKTSAFSVHEGGKLMVAACFGKREHLDGKHVHQKNALVTITPKTLCADVKTSTVFRIRSLM